SVTLSTECSTREGPRGNVSGHGRGSGAGFPCVSERGHGHRRYVGYWYPVAVDELRRFRHVVCFPGDRSGDECPASPLRQLTKPPVPRDVPSLSERTRKEFGFVDPAQRGVTGKKDFRVRTASSAV